MRGYVCNTDLGTLKSLRDYIGSIELAVCIDFQHITRDLAFSSFNCTLISMQAPNWNREVWLIPMSIYWQRHVSFKNYRTYETFCKELVIDYQWCNDFAVINYMICPNLNWRKWELIKNVVCSFLKFVYVTICSDSWLFLHGICGALWFFISLFADKLYET